MVKGNPLGHDIEIQCHSVFKNVKIILEEAGSSWNNLVDVTVFLTNIKEILIDITWFMQNILKRISLAEQQ